MLSLEASFWPNGCWNGIRFPNLAFNGNVVMFGYLLAGTCATVELIHMFHDRRWHIIVLPTEMVLIEIFYIFFSLYSANCFQRVKFIRIRIRVSIYTIYVELYSKWSNFWTIERLGRWSSIPIFKIGIHLVIKNSWLNGPDARNVKCKQIFISRSCAWPCSRISAIYPLHSTLYMFIVQCSCLVRSRFIDKNLKSRKKNQNHLFKVNIHFNKHSPFIFGFGKCFMPRFVHSRLQSLLKHIVNAFFPVKCDFESVKMTHIYLPYYIKSRQGRLREIAHFSLCFFFSFSRQLFLALCLFTVHSFVFVDFFGRLRQANH